VDSIAQSYALDAGSSKDLTLYLSTQVINTVYSYGSAAPETLSAALAIVEQCGGDLRAACLYANANTKSADSVPAMVGALCGCYQGAAAVGAGWREALGKCRGLCLPFLAGADIEALKLKLHQHRGDQT
jgi:ADP-ribosylglycohydrolase